MMTSITDPKPEIETLDGKRVHRVGTLVYTTPAMLALMGWLLWGDFCFNLMESVVPSVLPIKLRHLDAPNWVIALIMTTVPNLLNATVCPAVSFWSDRHRSPMGRRIPFIVYTLPFLCLFLILVGISPYLARALFKSGLIGNETFFALVILGIFATGFQFFNMFVASVYYYLFNDVVPPQYLGRFLAMFRFVGVLASAAFAIFVFPKAESHFTAIFVTAALLYGVGFGVMCWRVKEGEYPPAPEMPIRHGNNALLEGILTFFRESFSQKTYWLFYLFVAFWATAGTIGVFQIFFATSLNITLEQYGMLAGAVQIGTAGLLIPCGFLADKFHPVRTMLWAATLVAALSPLSLVFLFFPESRNWAFPIWCIVAGLQVPAIALFMASELPTYMKILPKERYGQFSASTAMIRSVASLSGGLLGGILLDVVKGWTSADEAYRYIPFWTLFFQCLSVLCLWLLYQDWKKRGGAQGYTPPDVTLSPAGSGK